MTKFYFFTCLLLPAYLFSQVNLKAIRKKSYQVFAYKIEAALAEKYILKDSIDIDALLPQNPFFIFRSDSVDETKLIPGNYIMISIIDNRVAAYLTTVSNLYVYPVNNLQRVQLLVINKNGDFINEAKVWVNGKQAPFNSTAQTYLVKQKNLDGALIKVYTQNDTLLSSLAAKEESNRTVPEQRWNNLKKTGFVRTISWLPRKIKSFFKEKGTYQSDYAGTTGMMVLSQPKYKKTDTVKCKAYVFNKHWKFYKKPVNIFLEYHLSGKSYKIFLKKLEPASPGSYIFQFPLGDSLQSDVSYTIVLRTADDKRILSKNFPIEDYLLDEIATYTLRASQDTYYANDTLRFYASVLNANGLSVLDASARLVLLQDNINGFYPDSLYVPDTLFTAEKPLLTSGETEFIFPAIRLADANLDIKAILVFKNANNELQEKNLTISYRPGHKEFTSFLEKDSVVTVYRENGKIVPAAGTLKLHNNWEETRSVQYPCKLKIDPLADAYSFYLIRNGQKIDSAQPEINERYEVALTRVSHGDTLGFILDNPLGIPVSFTVFDGNKITGSGKSSQREISWTTIKPNRNRAYRVTWQYQWRGEEKIKQQNIALLYKLLNIQMESSSTVFPGQNDTIAIQVKDYKNKPLAGVNLTAVSYNNQFSKYINVPEPPYLVNYKFRPGISRNKYEEEDEYLTKRYPLGSHQGWIKRFGLDSMPYYRMLSPRNGMLDVVTAISNLLPELSMHVVQKGERKEIYMLYINRKLAYYNGVTDKMKDAFQTYPGFTQIGIRLYDRFIEIDSIYTQPFYKHDLFIDIDSLPANSSVTKLEPVFTAGERLLLENSLWNLDNNYSTNNGYIWQGERLVQLSNNQEHVVGPFQQNDSLHFFKPEKFDIHFLFEAGYRYNLSKQVLRLEKKKIFPDETKEVKLKPMASPEWILGDTISDTPLISYPVTGYNNNPYLEISNYYSRITNADATGKLYFTVSNDTIHSYIILYPAGNPGAKIILSGNQRMITNIAAGEYVLLLVDRHWNTAEVYPLHIKASQTLCIRLQHLIYLKENPLVQDWIKENTPVPVQQNHPEPIAPVRSIQDMPEYKTGNAGITGKVTDKNGGHAIAGASIYVKGTRTGTSTSVDGSFKISNISAGKCTLVIASIGYLQKQLSIDVPGNGFTDVTISLVISTQALQDVVVTGYGTASKRSLTGSVTVIKDKDLTGTLLNNRTLQGRVAGLSVAHQDDKEGTDMSITIRGLSSFRSSGQRPLFVIDGIMYNEMPDNIAPDMIQSVNILKDAAATSVYGSRAAEGAIVISTKTKQSRTVFRDYAFWQPELFTDKNGLVKFSVTYPDNVTGWQTFILGMDKKRRMGKAVQFTKSYKPLTAQLNTPQFLIAGDTAELVGKSLNYSGDTYSLHTLFSINDIPGLESPTLLTAKASSISRYSIIAPVADSLKAAFAFQSTTGFKDGEERKIPVFEKGSLESKGQFWMLNKDTTFRFKAPVATGDIECFAQNNTLDILLSELYHLKKYPYYCMEQTASKLRGLLMEKAIRLQLHEVFDEDKTITLLTEKLRKAQLFDGGWSWWENGKANLYITNYIIQALLPLRSDPITETSIRNGLLYLQNQLPSLSKEQLLSCLLTMSEANHLTDYQTWLQKINFDSLTTHQQWQFVKISQRQHLGYEKELTILLRNGIAGILGGLHWGEENFRWYSNADATTVLAFEVLQKENGHERELLAILQYFLEQRRSGYWANTVCSASIVNALLPYVLSATKDFTKPAVIAVSGDTSFLINKYPFKLVMHNTHATQFNIQKTGGGLTYLTLYQQSWNSKPERVTDYFSISSHFEKNDRDITQLHSGEKITMVVNIEALKDADYVMIEIPIPAGCVYASKEQDDWYTHKEFLKNKLLLFTEKFNRGEHQYKISLESRYNGLFTLNPVQVSLMYFPVFFGRNAMRQVAIRPE